MVRQFLSILLAFLLTLFQFPVAALADTLDPGWSASVPTTTAQGIPMPDWSRITFASLPPVQSGGSISIPTDVAAKANGYNPSRSWQAGTPLADLFTLGDLQQDFGLEKLTLEAIAQRTGMDLSQVSLASFGLMKEQTISSLVAAIPSLGNYPLEQVKPLAEIVEAATGQRVSWQSQSMAPFAVLPLVIAEAASPGSGQSLNAVASDPNLGQQSLSSANLSQHSVNDIPGLSQTSLGEFDGWQQQAISTVPGLANVSFNSTPNSIADFLGFVGTDDVTYGDSGDVEHTSTETTHSITGSDKVGFNYQCDQGRSCAYLELASPSFLGNFGSPILHGAQWIKGGTDPGGQMVDGGHGVLGAVNGGKEPTGRLPFGPSVKVVLTGDNESDGSGTFGLYFRVCHSFLGCTPYFIGPVPFYSVHEKGVVIVGLTEMEKPSWIQQPDTPSDVQNTIDANDPGGSDNGVNLDSDCVSKVMSRVPQGDFNYASSTVPAILKEAQRVGITDSGQIAYILATAQGESDFHSQSEIGSYCGEYGSGCYYGRGYVQLTGKSNYQYWGNRLGIDLVNNPDLALQTDNATKILVDGMQDGTFTGKPLSQYISGNHHDFSGARNIVNPKDYKRRDTIATMADGYLDALNSCSSGTASGGYGKPGQSTGSFTYPVPGHTSVSGRFGDARAASDHVRAHTHQGVDFPASKGTPIVAADGGRVIAAASSGVGGYGSWIVVDNGNGTQEIYGHPSSINVHVGDLVAKGQTIGGVGAEGDSEGYHLHFQVMQGATSGVANSGHAVDPLPFLQSQHAYGSTHQFSS